MFEQREQQGFFCVSKKAAAAFLKQVLKSADRAQFHHTDQPRMVEPLASAEVAAARA